MSLQKKKAHKLKISLFLSCYDLAKGAIAFRQLLLHIFSIFLQEHTEKSSINCKGNNKLKHKSGSHFKHATTQELQTLNSPNHFKKNQRNIHIITCLITEYFGKTLCLR